VSAVVAGPRSQAVSETRKSASQIPFKRIVFILEDAARKARQFSRTSCAHSFVFGAERKLRARGASSPPQEKNFASRVDAGRANFRQRCRLAPWRFPPDGVGPFCGSPPSEKSLMRR